MIFIYNIYRITVLTSGIIFNDGSLKNFDGIFPCIRIVWNFYESATATNSTLMTKKCKNWKLKSTTNMPNIPECFINEMSLRKNDTPNKSKDFRESLSHTLLINQQLTKQ
uniref:Uncharacterized protein n=1 Tax=Onchocerca volvulus TaxID=6282 RepID=A0A8R1Y703_ONCVO